MNPERHRQFPGLLFFLALWALAWLFLFGGQWHAWAEENTFTSTPTPPPTPPQTRLHIVQAGETLEAIARRYGLTVEEIAAANHIRNTGFIYIGQELIIPIPIPTPTPFPLPEGARLHTVRAGETLEAIARRYNTTVEVLIQANAIADPSLLQVGQRLIIPAGPPEPGTSLLLASSTLTATFRPSPVLQGYTLVIELQSAQPITPLGFLDGQALSFSQEGNYCWALYGVPLQEETGPHPLELRIPGQNGMTTVVRGEVPVAWGNYPAQSVNLPPDRTYLLDPKLDEAEENRLRALCNLFTPERKWSGPFQAPLSSQVQVLSAFGGHRAYNGGLLHNRHTGVDLRAGAGAPVLAAAPGQVAFAGKLDIRGNTVILNHGRGAYSLYSHLAEIMVEEGQEVEKGALLGTVGDTGRAVGPHLHWEVRVGGICVEPLQWLRESIPR
ncbi:MAG: LysM peptidoglycan-binding domain-containing protein [Anaerolineae bacterium]